MKVLTPDGLFHPKAYLFFKGAGEWECLIGSPNFTRGGCDLNDEMAVLITNHDPEAGTALMSVRGQMEVYWGQASSISERELALYREAWKRNRSAVQRLREKFGNPDEDEPDDGGKSLIDVEILQVSWSDYYERVKSEQHEGYVNCLEQRLEVVRAVRALFAQHGAFSQIDSIGRRKIAGLPVPDGDKFEWFGCMKGNGLFQKAVNDNDQNLSLALDLIPSAGDVSRATYLAFVNQFSQAAPPREVWISTATRLLAMKRPDAFVCIDCPNTARLCKDFKIRRKVGYEEYWDSIVERIKAAAWWSSPTPTDRVERQVWEARAAFLDALFYVGRGPS
jgi:hypothetical protein